jgi:uncharacterized protein YfdQ (DUF2303 family)
MAKPIDKITHPAELGAILQAGANLGTPQEVSGRKPYALVPKDGGGADLVYLERQEAVKPDYITAHPKFDDAGSLIAYFNRFKDSHSTLFASIDSVQVVAAIDHHQAGATPTAGWNSHRATFTAKHSDEWKVWAGMHGKQMNQAQFAQFIEDNTIDIVRPDGATMLEVALSIEASKSGSFKSARRLDNGSISFGYVEEVSATAGSKGSLEIPKDFDVQLRPFIGCEKHRVTARLRYRIDDGQLRLWFELVRHEDVKRAAFDAIVAKIKDETETAILLGQG